MHAGAVRGLQGPRRFLGLPAPAKLNCFLHILGRRPDGYHEIQSVFVPLDLCDTLDVELRSDGRIVREGDLTGPAEADLAVRAAHALQAHAATTSATGATPPGATLRVEKCIPVGAGLGGGSSDAATTLIALNRLWDLRLQRPALAALARGLGADVPFFLGTGPAFVEGIGEQCNPVALPPAWYVLVYPQVYVSTAEIFADPKLTRNHKQTTIAGFSAALHARESSGAGGEGGADSAADSVVPLFGVNDLEPVVRDRYPAVDAAWELLGRCGSPQGLARMSGSGSAVFCELTSAVAAQRVLERVRARMPAGWSAWAVAGLARLPLAEW
jgi:4-diphosphocytidyl-2-C-methyl-D-erythritol kinase